MFWIGSAVQLSRGGVLKQTRSLGPFGVKCGICSGQCDVTHCSPISQSDLLSVSVVRKHTWHVRPEWVAAAAKDKTSARSLTICKHHVDRHSCDGQHGHWESGKTATAAAKVVGGRSRRGLERPMAGGSVDATVGSTGSSRTSCRSRDRVAASLTAVVHRASLTAVAV